MSRQDEKQVKEVTIIVNGREKTVQKNEELPFQKLVSLAFETPPSGPNIVFTITYRKGHSDKPEGTLQEDDSVKSKEGMIFNVTPTDKS